MGNTVRSTKAVKPSNEKKKTKDQQPQQSKQDLTKGHEHKENVDKEQLPQQLKQDALEGHTRLLHNGDINIDMLPPHWKYHACMEPKRDAIEWFLILLTAYNQHKTIIMEILSKSDRNKERTHCPTDMNDESFDIFARKTYSEKTNKIPSSWTKTTMNQELCDCINKCLKKKVTLIKLGKLLEENNRLILDGHTLQKKIIELQDEKNQALLQKEKSEKTLNRIQDQVQREKERVRNFQRQLEQTEREKEHLLTRLSKIAGSKLISNNPDIADLNDDNRPNKLAEKFGQLYDDAWTNSIEELTKGETRIDEREAINLLLRIVMEAYQFCSSSRSMFLDLTDCKTVVTCKNTTAMKAIGKLPDAITPDIQQATKKCLRAKESTLISEIKKKFADRLNGILNDITKRDEFLVSNEYNVDSSKEAENDVMKNKSQSYCLHEIKTIQDNVNSKPNKKMKKRRKKVSHLESVNNSQPCNEENHGDKWLVKRENTCDFVSTFITSRPICPPPLAQFAETTYYGDRCVELCWFMQTTQPPIHLSARIPDDGMMKNDIFRAYMKSGTEVDYIVWPVMYLYENGPILKKGVAQPK